MVGCAMYGVWQYVQHAGHKPSQRTLMSSPPELHIFYLLSANNDFRNEPENPNMATGWWLQQALCVFKYSGFLVTASFPLVFELTAAFLPVLEFLSWV